MVKKLRATTAMISSKFRVEFTPLRLYNSWRLNGVDRITCAVNLFFYTLLFALIPFEKGAYNQVFKRFDLYFPQIKRNKPKLFDPVRFAVQGIFLLFIKQTRAQNSNSYLISNRIYRLFNQYLVKPILTVTTAYTQKLANDSTKVTTLLSSRYKKFVIALLIISFIFSILIVTQPFDVTYQFIFVALMWTLAIILKSVKNRVALMLMIFISITISTRYIYWRISKTILISDGFTTFCAIVLLLAEIYAYLVMVLSYFQVSWVLDRKPYPLPKDTSLWPSVDIFIPSYNEPLEVVKPCLLAALDLDWPKDKLKVHMLDDGSRKDFEQYCKEIGVNYIKRDEHNHAKAGNINHALTVTNGDLVAIFDCDHVPVRAFLQMTVGWMVHDENIALVQTPHHFYSQDPFEKNLSLHGDVPAENSLFHDFIQKGNDTWNATMFCGSCAVIRRKPLLEIGGIAVETVTEDAHTSLRLNRKGYSSAFISMPLAAGLATESLADHINQRIRWARGMVQIFRIDNPFTGKGLTLPQRICFANAMIHFLHGIPRIIFLIAPLPYLFFNTYVIFATGLAILSFVLPHMLHSTMTNQRIQGNKRFYFWGVVYETILSWYITVPTLVALISPKHGKFNVTAKGASNEATYFDWSVSKPYVLLIIINFMALVYGIYNIIFNPFCEVSTVVVNLLWVLYNLLILGAASAVALEAKQVRASPRVLCDMKGKLELDNGYVFNVDITDSSKEGLGIRLPIWKKSNKNLCSLFKLDQSLKVHIKHNLEDYVFNAKVKFSSNNKLGLQLELKTKEENIKYIRCTFACADRWSHSFENLHQDTLLHGIHTLVTFGFNGYLKMLNNVPHGLKEILWVMVSSLKFIFSLLPQPLDIRFDRRVLRSDKNAHIFYNNED